MRMIHSICFYETCHQNAADQVVNHAVSPHDKLDGYGIQHSIIINTCNPTDAVRLKCTILQLLESMGEHMPPNLSDECIESEVAVAIQCFESISDCDLLHMYTNSDTNNQADIIRAYALLAILASLGNSRMSRYYVARWVQFCLKYKVKSKFIPGEILFLVLSFTCSVQATHVLVCVISYETKLSGLCSICSTFMPGN